MRVGIVTGGFDPIHRGHIAYIQEAKKHCDYLMVGVNDDYWLANKKGKAFMPLEDRVSVVSALKGVDQALPIRNGFEAIQEAHREFPGGTLVFMNGGDRTELNIPEVYKAQEANIKVEFLYGIGGEDKKNSSSWILEEWTNESK